MPDFRRTKGILNDTTDPLKDADVIMTAAILGFAVDYVRTNHQPIRFDMDPLDYQPKDQKKWQKVEDHIWVVGKINQALLKHEADLGLKTAAIWGFSPKYDEGRFIMGVSPGKTPPSDLAALPEISPNCKRMYEEIRAHRLPDYAGRGAYTGFVDNPNMGAVGPLPTARFKVPAPGSLIRDPYPRWLPPFEENRSALWIKRRRRGTEEELPRCWVPWGLIGGDDAGEEPDPRELDYPPPPDFAKNRADQTTANMKRSGMRFTDEPFLSPDTLFRAESWGYKPDYIAAYTHGMIQAICRGACLGEDGWVPYEIAEGDVTKKLASCIPCTLFMYAIGYLPTSIHLGRGESWAPLYAPYSHTLPYTGKQGTEESEIIRALNNQWYNRCADWLRLGLDILAMKDCIRPDHEASRDALKEFYNHYFSTAMIRDDQLGEVPTVGGVLILDALTIHDSETNRLDHTLNY
jgi:hypothetical protein